MVQKAQHYTERNDWPQPTNSGNQNGGQYGSQDQSKWIWGALAALALAGLLVWMATSGGPQTSPVTTNIQKQIEQSAPAPAEPQIAPAQPAPVEPTPPGQTPQQQ